MIYLLLSVACSTCIMALFKIYRRYDINNFHAIIVNYYVSSTLGITLSGRSIDVPSITNSKWFMGALMIGASFVLLFYMMAYTADKVGVAISQMSNKMSVVVVVVSAIWLLGEEGLFLKFFGVVLALLGATLALISKKDNRDFDKKYLYLPVVLFFLAGIVDSLFNYTKKLYVPNTDNELFLSVVFVIAATVGTSIIIYQVLSKTRELKLKSIIGGLLLGFINFGSIYFLVLALGVEDFLDSSSIFPIRNIGIVATTAIMGYAVFRERLSKINWIGIFLVLVAIATISWAKQLHEWISTVQ